MEAFWPNGWGGSCVAGPGFKGRRLVVVGLNTLTHTGKHTDTHTHTHTHTHPHPHTHTCMTELGHGSWQVQSVCVRVCVCVCGEWCAWVKWDACVPVWCVRGTCPVGVTREARGLCVSACVRDPRRQHQSSQATRVVLWKTFQFLVQA